MWIKYSTHWNNYGERASKLTKHNKKDGGRHACRVEFLHEFKSAAETKRTTSHNNLLKIGFNLMIYILIWCSYPTFYVFRFIFSDFNSQRNVFAIAMQPSFSLSRIMPDLNQGLNVLHVCVLRKYPGGVTCVRILYHWLRSSHNTSSAYEKRCLGKGQCFFKNPRNVIYYI
jgi:hypothetical protein